MPSLPKLPKNKDNDDYRFLDKLGIQLIQFLGNCFLAPSLKCDKFLCEFVIENLPLSHFMDEFTNINRNKPPKNIG